MKEIYFLHALLCLFFIFPAKAQNPIVKDIGMSDPHVRVFKDTLFLFCGHDSDPQDKTWVMKNWRIFSTTDLTNWIFRETISPEDNYMDDNTRDCWAGDAAERNGKYYFYFSDRKRGIGVMVSESPAGSYKDALGKPLVAPMHDPTILIDDDSMQTPYLIYGDKHGGGFHIARLHDDMISLAEQPEPIEINGEEWEKAPQWMDKNYLFKHENTYYLSWGRDYAISKNIYGPYGCVGAVGNGHHLSEYAHGSFFNWRGQFYHIWCYYLTPGYKYRESIITYCHMADNGDIVTDTRFLDKHFNYGVGHYNAAWDTIEAEWYYEVSGGIQKKGDKGKGFVLTNIGNGDWIRFANISFEKEYKKFKAKMKVSEKGGVLEIRSNSLTGNLIGEITINPPQNSKPAEYSIDIKIFTGEKDIYLVYKGPEETRLQIDWFRFE